MLKSVDGQTVAYKETGTSNACMVILQGWGTTFSIYDGIAAHLTETERFRVVQLDLPGFGASPEPPEAWTVAQYADFACTFIGSLGVESVTLMAHSFGGRIAFELAVRDELPFAIDRLVLVDVAGIVREKTQAEKSKVARYKALRRLADNPTIYAMFPDLIDDWRSRQGSRDYRNASPLMKQVLVKAVNYDQKHLMPQVSCPTNLIWGENDQETPLAFAQTMQGLIEGSTLAVVPDAGHFPFAENAPAFLAALDEALGDQKGDTPLVSSAEDGER